MSNTTSTGSSSSPETLRTAREAVDSAAERIKAAGPAAYDAGAKAAQYVGSTASEYPLTTLLVTAALAYLAGVLTNSYRDGQQNWQNSADAIGRQVWTAAPRMPRQPDMSVTKSHEAAKMLAIMSGKVLAVPATTLHEARVVLALTSRKASETIRYRCC